MKKIKMRSRFEVSLKDSFRRMWIIAVCVAIVAIIPTILFEDRAQWILLVAMVASALLGLFVEIRQDLRKRQRARLLTVALEQQKLEADYFARLYTDGADRREEQYREAKINDPASMKRRPAFAS